MASINLNAHFSPLNDLSKMTLTRKQEVAVHEVKKYIDSIPLTRIPVSELIELSGLSEDKLSTGFKMLYQETIYSYQLQLSMEKAAELLRQGLSVKSVALAAGYKAQGNFTRAFFKVMKITPSQYQTDMNPQ